jgi:hypothetical protein
MEMTPPGAEEPGREQPFFIWVLMVILVLFSLGSGLRLLGALRSWETLAAFGVQPGPLYIALSGGVFALAFLASALALGLRLRAAAWMVRVTVVAYGLWYWVDRLAVDQTRQPENSLFLACLTAFLLLFALAAVWIKPD